MAVEKLPWRKFPTDTIGNGKLQIIARGLPQNIRHAASTVFIAFYCTADDDGMIDCTDKEALAYNCMLDLQELDLVICKMLERNLIQKVFPEDNRPFYIIVDWLETNTLKRPYTRTIEQRLNDAVNAMNGFNPNSPPRAAQKKAQGTDAPPAADFPAEMLKNENNLPYKEREIEREKDEIDQTKQREKKDTHTERTPAAPADMQTIGLPEEKQKRTRKKAGDSPTEGEKNQKKTTAGKDAAGKTSGDGCGRDGGVVTDTENDIDGDMFVAVFDLFENFFLEHSEFGFVDMFGETVALKELSEMVMKLADDTHSPEIVASVLCSKVLKLGQNVKYYEDMPIIPSNFVKPGALKHIIYAAQKTLYPQNNANNNWTAKMDQLKKDAESDMAKNGDSFASLYEQYGINPDNPNRASLLMEAKRRK